LHEPDALLLSGDLFDRSVPPEDAVERLDLFLSNAVLKLNVPVIMIPGNHDSSTRIGAHAGLLRAAGLHVFSKPESIYHPVKLGEGAARVSVYGVPYLEPAEWGFYFSLPLRTHAEAMTQILESLKPLLENDKLEGRRSVLLLHAYVTGGQATDSERPLSIGGSELVPSEPLEVFDYVALGHLHRPQKVGLEKIQYPGSLFPYSLSEAGQKKGIVLAKLGAEPTEDSFEFLEFKTPRRLHALRGSLEEILEPAPESSNGTTTFRADDYVIAVLTDPSLPTDAFRRLAKVYPGLLHVSRESTWDRSAANDADRLNRALRRDISDQDLLSQFVALTASTELSAEDRQWLSSELDAFSKAEDSGALS